MNELIATYLADVEAEYKRGNATEHSYRPALKSLIESFVSLGRELCALHLMEFEVGRGGTPSPASVDSGDAVPPVYLSEISFPVAGDHEVVKGFPKFTVAEAAGLGPRSGNAATEPRSGNAATEEEQIGRVHINPTQYFDGVPSKVWNFTIGGYQVCEKWLKDRRGRVLSLDDVRHYQKIVVALQRTDELMIEVDQAIPQWPVQ